MSCTFCPPEDIYPVKDGCFVDGKPSCEWCAYVSELVAGYEAGEIKPLSPEGIGKLAGDQQKDNEVFVCSGCRQGWCSGCVADIEF